MFPQDRLNSGAKEVKCRMCKQSGSLQLSISLLQEAEDLFEQGAVLMNVRIFIFSRFLNFYSHICQVENVDDAIKSFKAGIEMFHKVALPPHKDLHIAQEALRACLSTAGNTFEV